MTPIGLDSVFFGDCRDTLRDLIAQGVKVQTCVTSPPYFGLRDYGHAGQLGLEPTPAAYVENMVDVFRLVRDLLADDGVLWLNLGDSYAATTGGVGNNPSAKSTLTTNGGRCPQPGDKYAQGHEGRRVKLMPDVPAKTFSASRGASLSRCSSHLRRFTSRIVLTGRGLLPWSMARAA